MSGIAPPIASFGSFSGVAPLAHAAGAGKHLLLDLGGKSHPMQGRPVRLAWERSSEIAAIVDARVIVFQCPKSFLPTRENVRNLSAFFRDIDRGGRILAWEPRGADWSPSLVRELCAANHLIHCVDPFESDPSYGDALYWRLHGKGSYRYKYTDDDLAALHCKLLAHQHLPGPNYILFNNIYSKDDALRFRSIPPSET